MIVGIHCEGSFDDKTLRRLIKKIAREAGVNEKIDFRTKLAEGSITKSSTQAALGLFIDIKPECVFAVFVTDTDNKKDKCATIRKSVKDCLSEVGDDFGVFGCPDPVIEQWFLDEEDAIKNILHLPGDKPLPYTEIVMPKERYHSMINKLNDDITKTESEIHLEIVDSIDCGKLKGSSKSFSAFYRDISTKLRSS